MRFDERDGAVFNADLNDLGLLHGEAFLHFKSVLHELLVETPVRLRAQRIDRRALPAVQEPVLDAGAVCDLRHLAAERVELADEVALARAADGGVAGHIAHRVEVYGEANGRYAEPRGGERRLDPGVSRADHCDIKFSREKFGHNGLREIALFDLTDKYINSFARILQRGYARRRQIAATFCACTRK